MDGVHDMGGMDGFGKVEPEPNEPVFHAPWEGRVLAMQRAMGYAGAWNIDMSRVAQERLAAARSISPPPTTSAGRWRWSSNVLERGFAGADELAAGHALHAGQAAQAQAHDGRGRARAHARLVLAGRRRRPRASSPATACARRTSIRATHTRLPRYVRGHVGVVERVHGCHVFPDTVALDQGENPQWLYTVVFDSRELWGDDADPTMKISDRCVRAVSGAGVT